MSTDAVVTEDLTIRFGGLTAVDNVNLRVPAASRRAVIGPNGAGKTTLFNLVAGQLQPTEGRVLVSGEDVTDLAVHERTRRGLARTFQMSNLFGQLSVADNVRLAVVGTDRVVARNFWKPLSGFAHVEARVEELLVQWGLEDVAAEPPDALSYGQQRILELVLATAGQPRVLLLDEPTAGVSNTEAASLADTIRGLPRDLTIVLVEHDMEIAFDLADEVTVMVDGRELVTGTPDEVAGDERVIEAYLGRDDDAA